MHPKEQVSIVEPSFCDPQKSQTFCSIFQSNVTACGAYPGSPILCNNDLKTIDGILLGNSYSCNERDNEFSLEYTSLINHTNWINQTMQVEIEEDSKFIVAILDYDKSFQDSEFKCYATIFTERHVLTTATCIQSIKKNTAIQVQFRNGATTTSTSRNFIHPDFDSSKPTENNIAIVLLDGKFLSPIPRKLGGLKTKSSCKIFGWGGSGDFPIRHRITVNAPSSCNPQKPNIYCSVFDSADETTCNARPGSPIVCSDDISTVDGILIGNNSNCNNMNGKYSLEYLSVDDFIDWIEKTSGNQKIKSSFSLMVVAITIVSFFKR